MELTHYIVVRRDLPFGTILAMVTHAAGESFYAPLAQPEQPTSVGGSDAGNVQGAPSGGSSETVEQSGLSRKVGGSSPSPRTTLGPIAVVLGARNEKKLERLRVKLMDAGIPFVSIHEPDAPWNGQLMALGLVPTTDLMVSKMVNDFQLFKEMD